MTVMELLSQCAMLSVTLAAGDDGKLRVSPPGVLSAELRAQLQAHKGTLRRLLTAPPADFLSDEPCDVCASRERWLWLDGRELCRMCLILDLMPMSLLSGITGGRD
jgi:hypothetical protein